jgi:hypothetical protein
MLLISSSKLDKPSVTVNTSLPNIPSGSSPITLLNSDGSSPHSPLILALTFGCLILFIDLLLLFFLIRARKRSNRVSFQQKMEKLPDTPNVLDKNADQTDRTAYNNEIPQVVDKDLHQRLDGPSLSYERNSNFQPGSVSTTASEYSYRSSRPGSFDPKVAALWQNARDRIRSLTNLESGSVPALNAVSLYECSIDLA